MTYHSDFVYIGMGKSATALLQNCIKFVTKLLQVLGNLPSVADPAEELEDEQLPF